MRTGKILGILAITLSIVSCNKNGVSNKPLSTEVDSVSYSIGLGMGSQIRAGFDEINLDAYLQGLRNGMDSTDILIDQNETGRIIQAYMKERQAAEREKQAAEAAKKAEEQFGNIKEAGEKFLAENISKDGVQTTESGLQYIVLEEGTGEKPTAASKVKVHYHGTTIDGTVFDSSLEKDPIQFAVTGVIKGWTEGLQLMPVGSKYKFFIPQELAYGSQQRGQHIKPFSALVFEVELLEIVK